MFIASAINYAYCTTQEIETYRHKKEKNVIFEELIEKILGVIKIKELNL